MPPSQEHQEAIGGRTAATPPPTQNEEEVGQEAAPEGAAARRSAAPPPSDEVYRMYSEAIKTVHDTADRLGQKVHGHAEGRCVEWPGVLCGPFKCHLRAIYTLVMTPLHIRKVEVPDEWKNALAQDILDAKVPLDVLPKTLISLVQQLRMKHYHIHHESHAHIIRYCVPNTMHYHYFTITTGLKEDYHLKGKGWL